MAAWNFHPVHEDRRTFGRPLEATPGLLASARTGDGQNRRLSAKISLSAGPKRPSSHIQDVAAAGLAPPMFPSKEVHSRNSATETGNAILAWPRRGLRSDRPDLESLRALVLWEKTSRRLPAIFIGSTKHIRSTSLTAISRRVLVCAQLSPQSDCLLQIGA